MKHNKHILFLLLGTCLGFLPSYAETVYFKNKAVWDYSGVNVKWGEVYIHYWGDGITGTSWDNSPKMEYIGNDWWKYDISAKGGTYNFVCKNTKGDTYWKCNDVTNQTGNVACYFTEGGIDKLAFTDIPDNRIYYDNGENQGEVYVHLWNDNNSIDATPWGQLADLKDEGDGWWSAPIVRDNCDCLFASDASGNNKKTGDLHYDKANPYYQDGVWYTRKVRRTMAFSEGSITNWWRQGMTIAADEESTQHTQFFETAVTEGEFGIQECKNHVVTDQLHWWWVSKPTTITKDTTIDLVCSNGDKDNPNGINPKITVGANKRVTFTYFYDSHKLRIEYASTITFDLQGHGEIPSQSVKVGGTITRPADPITNDYIFVGWYTDAECTQAYDFNTIVNDNLTLYAKWEEKYRLAYVETLNGTTQVFHPSHWITPSNSPRQDTISLYVKPFERKNSNPNPHTCQVWLEKYKYTDENGMVWEKKTAIDIKENASVFESNGVYNFVLVQDENGISVPTEKITPYDGNYYIRIGLDEDYRSEENQFRFSDYASKYDDRFDHYFCKYKDAANDVRFCVACDYSACVSDTLVQEPADDLHHAYTNENGTLLYSANVRFMWNSENNHIDRDYLASAGQNVHLLSEAGIFTSDGSAQATDVVLVDREDWLYQADVTAETLARVKLYVKPYDGAPEEAYQYLKGAEGDYSDANTIQLIGGTNGKTLKVRVIYDFKSNHLICAWLPEDNSPIEGELPLQSDLILIRETHKDAQQITFSNDDARITKVSQAYGVISLPHAHFESTTVSDNAKKFYWISFPFDVHLSEVFSVLTYGTDYVVKYYDGASRAAEGCWIDSPSFWKMYRSREGVTLQKGMGYLLHVNINDISRFFVNGNTDINIYFPSANTDSLTINGKIETVTVPAHPCTIQRDNRYIYDSNWNLIGVPTWANVSDMGLPNATEMGDVKFLYEYVPETNGYNTVAAETYNFGSMKAYMVQFAGTINWKDRAITPSQKPLRAPVAGGEEVKTVRLELLRDEEVLDQTFVQLSDADGITEGFDLNYDLTKIQNSGCNLYSLIGSEQIEAAANILPYSEQTVYVPLGVIADRDGVYTFALPEEMEGMDVRIADAETGYSHNLLLSPYEVALTAGTYTQRFSLEIHASSNVTTGCTETNAAGERLRKLLLDGHLFIQRGEKVYDAQGRQIR